jgi:hypothetical protein
LYTDAELQKIERASDEIDRFIAREAERRSAGKPTPPPLLSVSRWTPTTTASSSRTAKDGQRSTGRR